MNSLKNALEPHNRAYFGAHSVMPLRIALALLYLLLLSSLLACHNVRVASNVAAGQPAKPGRILVVLSHLEQAGIFTARQFYDSLREKLAASNVESRSVVLGDLELDEAGKIRAALVAFKPSHQLIVSVTSTTQGRYGIVIGFSLDASLFDAAKKQRVWRAIVSSSGATRDPKQNADNLANSIITKLRDDRLL